MTAFLEKYSHTLIEKILQASTQEEVKCLCDASVTWLEGRRVTATYINQFAENGIKALHQFTPMNSDVVQWTNISAARIYLHRIKKNYPFTIQ